MYSIYIPPLIHSLSIFANTFYHSNSFNNFSSIFLQSNGSMRKPFLQFLTISIGPPSFVATMGRPLAAASINVSPNGSVSAGLMKTPFNLATYL